MNKLPLPDGTSTSDVEVFSKEWNQLTKPFEDMGFMICGYSPGISICDKETGRGQFDLPIYAARRIIENLKQQENNQ